VLKVANSIFYRGLNRVDTVKEAILRLGTKELGNVVMWAIHQSNFQSKDPFVNTCQKRLWFHSLSVALGSQWLANFLDLEDVQPKAFVAGLLHDMGTLYLLSALEKVKKDKLISTYPTAFLMEEIIDSLHGDQGAFLLNQWNLADDFSVVAKTHHGDDFDRTNVLLVLVRLVDRVCHKMEKGGQQADDALAIAGSTEASLLGVTDINLAELEIYLEDVQKKISLV
jgi:HD-like signal output (HDOD) protein